MRTIFRILNICSFMFNSKKIANELMAAVVVFLVSLPLCLGVAIASGVSPVVGLISGVVGGIVASSFAGCSLQITGPAGGLIVIVLEIIDKFGIESLGWFVIACGLIQVAIGFLRFAPWFQAVSPAVIQGMLSGIGVLILISQFYVMVGIEAPATTLAGILELPDSLGKIISPSHGSTNHIASAVGLLTLLVIAFWNYVPAKLRSIPSTLAAVIVVTLCTVIMKLPIKKVSIPSNPSEILGSITFPSFERLGELFSNEAMVLLLTLTFIASAEALITCGAIDKMHTEKRTHYNREIVAQGLANLCCGFLGALPLTGVIARSVAAYRAGGRTQWIGVAQGLMLLCVLFLFSSLAEFIPIASLAAILVYISIKLINIQAIRGLVKYGKSELVIFVITTLTIIGTNLMEGVMVGFFCSVFKLMYSLSRFNCKLLKGKEENECIVELNGAISFVNLPSLNQKLAKIPQKKDLHIKFNKLRYIDHACLECITSWEKQYVSKGGNVFLEWEELEAKVISSNSNNTKPFISVTQEEEERVEALV